MGLLDEAIREHLELKRRSGADPAEIAHEEHAVLDPVFPAEQRLDGNEGALREPSLEDPGSVTGSTEDLSGAAAVDSVAAQPPVPVEPAHVGQETAEIDMQAVLGEDGHAETERERGPGESFEWDSGVTAQAQSAEHRPDQERLSFE